MKKMKITIQELQKEMSKSAQNYSLCSSSDGGGSCGDGVYISSDKK